MSDKNLIELENGAYKVKIKLSQAQIFVEDTQVEPMNQTSDNSIFDSENLVIPESQENKDTQRISLLHSDNKETPKRPPKNTEDPAVVQYLSKMLLRRKWNVSKLLRKQLKGSFKNLKKLLWICLLKTSKVIEENPIFLLNC